MDLFNKIYSTNTVREHPAETKWNASGYNGVWFILKSSNIAETNIYPGKPAIPQDLNDKVLKPNGYV